MNGGRVMVAIFLSSSGLLCGKKECQRSCALPFRRRQRVKFCFACVSEHMFTLLYLPSIQPSYTHKDKSSSWAPDHILNTCTLSRLQGSRPHSRTAAVRQGRSRGCGPWITDTVSECPPPLPPNFQLRG